jgi:hypothetical protein
MRHQSATKIGTTLFAACALLSAAVAPRAQAQTPVRFSGAAALVLPVGDLGNASDPGIDLAFRGEGPIGSRGWSLRGDLTWDRFPGRGIVDSYSYLGVAANLVHRDRGDRLYEFGGLGLYGDKTELVNSDNHSDTNLGLQIGLGLDLAGGQHPPFVEFGLTTAFTSGGNSIWLPVRVGIRF